MRYACSMVAFVDGGLPFRSLVFLHLSWIFLSRSLNVLSAKISRCFRSRSSASDLTDAGWVGWVCRMRTAGKKRPVTLFTAFFKVFMACSTVLVSPASAMYSSQASA